MIVGAFDTLAAALERASQTRHVGPVHVLAVDLNAAGAKRWLVVIAHLGEISSPRIWHNHMCNLALEGNAAAIRADHPPVYVVVNRSTVYGYMDIDGPPDTGDLMVVELARLVVNHGPFQIWKTSPGHYHIHWPTSYELPELKSLVERLAIAEGSRLGGYIDTGVYHIGRCIRLPFCAKIGGASKEPCHFENPSPAYEGETFHCRHMPADWAQNALINMQSSPCHTSESVRPTPRDPRVIAPPITIIPVVGKYKGTAHLPGGICPISGTAHLTAGSTMTEARKDSFVHFCFHDKCRAAAPRGCVVRVGDDGSTTFFKRQFSGGVEGLS
jgi:hypothetical protein